MSEAPDQHCAIPSLVESTPEEAHKNEKLTPGEELWQVHLYRAHFQAVSSDDFDHEVVPSAQTKKTPEQQRSIGEELWGIHCKRSRDSLNEDYDDKDEKHKKEVARKNPVHKIPSDTSKIIHLRTRDVKVAP